MNIEVSVFINKSDKKFDLSSKGTIQLYDLAKRIKEDPGLKKLTEKYRESLAEYGKSYEVTQGLKKRFIMISPTGQFGWKDNKGFIPGTFTNVCAFDIDIQDNEHITNWEDLRCGKIETDPHVLACFSSPSGGLKGLIAIHYTFTTPEQFQQDIISYVYPHFENKWGIKLDPAQATFSQGLWICHDPHPHVNTDVQPYVFEKTVEKAPITYKPGANHSSAAQVMSGFLKMLSDTPEHQVFNTIKKAVPIPARMYKGGALQLPEEDIKRMLLEALLQSPGLKDPEQGKQQIDAFWKKAVREYEPITQQQTASKKFMDEMAFRIRCGFFANDNPYVLIGSQIYENVFEEIDGTYYRQLVKMTNQSIRLKHPDKDEYNALIWRMPKCSIFVNEPNFFNYQRVLGKGYNLTYPLNYKPVEGEWKTIEKVLRRSFEGHFEHPEGDSFDFIMDWIQLLITKPKQKLPGIIMKSGQNTGKSTILKMLMYMLGYNAVKIRMSDLTNNFNLVYAMSTLTVVDETEYGDGNFNSHLESIVKNLITESEVTIEAKGKDQFTAPQHNHLIMASNKEKPIQIPDDDTRFIVFRIPEIKEKKDPKIMDKIADEVPHFVHHLQKRKLVFPDVERTYFPLHVLDTEAKREIQEMSKGSFYVALKEAFLDYFEDNPHEKDIRLNQERLKAFLLDRSINYYRNEALLIGTMDKTFGKKRKMRVDWAENSQRVWVVTPDRLGTLLRNGLEVGIPENSLF